jgi:biotin carboxyl carrier protein
VSRPLEERVAVHVEPDASDARDEIPIATRGVPRAATPTAPNGGATIARLADELLPLLIARLGSSSLGELEVRQDGWRVRLRRQPNGEGSGRPRQARAGRVADRAQQRVADRQSDAASVAAAAATSGAGRGESGAQASRRADPTLITSPAVGYYQPRDGLSVGTTVRGGDLLGHVDVLGVLQDVVAPIDGRLSRLLAEPAEAVEYGQPLARLEPESRS